MMWMKFIIDCLILLSILASTMALFLSLTIILETHEKKRINSGK